MELGEAILVEKSLRPVSDIVTFVFGLGVGLVCEESRKKMCVILQQKKMGENRGLLISIDLNNQCLRLCAASPLRHVYSDLL